MYAVHERLEGPQSWRCSIWFCDDGGILAIDQIRWGIYSNRVMLFRDMKDEKETWMNSYSAVVDCMIVALKQGDIVQRGIVA